MSDDGERLPADGDALRAHAEALERRVQELESRGAEQLIDAELRLEAVRAGMVDLDGLKLVDRAGLRPDEAGAVAGAAGVMAALRRDKPWLFAAQSSSRGVPTPPSAPLRTKLATEMSLEEWRHARAELLRGR
jgi:hypothetical protein